MKKLLLTMLLMATGAAVASGDGALLVEKARDLQQAETVLADYRVTIVRPDWQREIVLHVQEDRQTRRYVAELSAPRKLKGTQFLKADDRLWMYMPRLQRRVGISPTMMLEPWMGSDLTNQDLLQADAVVDGYTHHIVSNEQVDGHTVHTIRSEPRADAAVVWGHLEQRIRADGVPLRVDYYDRDGSLTRRITFSEPREFDGRTLPSHWRITPMPESGSHTEVRVENLRFDVPLTEGAFVQLQKGGPKHDS